MVDFIPTPPHVFFTHSNKICCKTIRLPLDPQELPVFYNLGPRPSRKVVSCFIYQTKTNQTLLMLGRDGIFSENLARGRRDTV